MSASAAPVAAAVDRATGELAASNAAKSAITTAAGDAHTAASDVAHTVTTAQSAASAAAHVVTSTALTGAQGTASTSSRVTKTVAQDVTDSVPNVDSVAQAVGNTAHSVTSTVSNRSATAPVADVASANVGAEARVGSGALQQAIEAVQPTVGVDGPAPAASDVSPPPAPAPETVADPQGSISMAPPTEALGASFAPATSDSLAPTVVGAGARASLAAAVIAGCADCAPTATEPHAGRSMAEAPGSAALGGADFAPTASVNGLAAQLAGVSTRGSQSQLFELTAQGVPGTPAPQTLQAPRTQTVLAQHTRQPTLEAPRGAGGEQRVPDMPAVPRAVDSATSAAGAGNLAGSSGGPPGIASALMAILSHIAAWCSFSQLAANIPSGIVLPNLAPPG